MNNFFDYRKKVALDSDEQGEEVEFIPIITEEEEDELTKLNVPDVLPILPLRNTVLFPGVVIPITISGRNPSNLSRMFIKKIRSLVQLPRMM